MNTNEELTPKEQPTEQPTSEKQESNEPPKKKRVHGPMQLRVFQMMGMRLDVKKKDADSESYYKLSSILPSGVSLRTSR